MGAERPITLDQLARILPFEEAGFLLDLIAHCRQDFTPKDNHGYALCTAKFLANDRRAFPWTVRKQERFFANLKRRGFVRTQRHGKDSTSRNVRWVFVDIKAVKAALDSSEQSDTQQNQHPTEHSR